MHKMWYRSRALALLLVLLAGTALAQQKSGATTENELLDADASFLGVTLGSHVDSLNGLVKQAKDFEHKECYRLPSQVLDFGGAKLISVDYLFWEKKLHSIRIRTEGAAATERLKEVLILYYGEPYQLGMESFYTWQGKVVRLTIDENLITHNAWTTFTHIPTDKEFSKQWRRE